MSVLVDSNVILDVLTGNSHWAGWSSSVRKLMQRCHDWWGASRSEKRQRPSVTSGGVENPTTNRRTKSPRWYWKRRLSHSWATSTRYSPSRRMCSFSMPSISRTPTSTQLSGFTLGEKLKILESSGGPSPMIAASGMPCTLPLGEESGVLISLWASIQIRPIFCS